MICPACKNPTIVVERKKIELDYCPHCQGVWFDSGELELLLANLGLSVHSEFIENVLKQPEAKSGEKARRCPYCAHKMRKAVASEHPTILIDACRRGDGLWFDAGELESLVRQLAEEPAIGAESSRAVSVFFGEVFQARDQA